MNWSWVLWASANLFDKEIIEQTKKEIAGALKITDSDSLDQLDQLIREGFEAYRMGMDSKNNMLKKLEVSTEQVKK